VKVWSLGSGSRGNALVVSSDDRYILVDCGFGPRALAMRLKRVGLAPEMIEALVITHEHQDHADGAAKAHHKWRWPVYASAGTHAALRDIPTKYRHELRAGVAVTAGDFTIEATPIPHDAREPMAVAIGATASGARVGIAHDLGAVPTALETLFARCDALCLEANHDPDMLRHGPYPRALQERIRGGRGHIDNATAAALAARLAHPGLQAIALLHLSETNNTPELAARSVNAALSARRPPVTAQPAPGREPALLFSLANALAPRQFTLAL
jgi:phosphoribosyl 1,2-cyclic phosphodiesterase